MKTSFMKVHFYISPTRVLFFTETQVSVFFGWTQDEVALTRARVSNCKRHFPFRKSDLTITRRVGLRDSVNKKHSVSSFFGGKWNSTCIYLADLFWRVITAKKNGQQIIRKVDFGQCIMGRNAVKGKVSQSCSTGHSFTPPPFRFTVIPYN